MEYRSALQNKGRPLPKPKRTFSSIGVMNKRIGSCHLVSFACELEDYLKTCKFQWWLNWLLHDYHPFLQSWEWKLGSTRQDPLPRSILKEKKGSLADIWVPTAVGQWVMKWTEWHRLSGHCHRHPSLNISDLFDDLWSCRHLARCRDMEIQMTHWLPSLSPFGRVRNN